MESKTPFSDRCEREDEEDRLTILAPAPGWVQRVGESDIAWNARLGRMIDKHSYKECPQGNRGGDVSCPDCTTERKENDEGRSPR